MSNIYENITELVGKTPLIALSRLGQSEGCQSRVLVKLESFNPSGSVKDRAALSMVVAAEEQGLLQAGGAIVEPTSGNTGIALASIAASRGYDITLTMPETMSIERRKLLAAYGAKIVLTSGALGMKGAIAEAEKLAKEEGMLLLGQFQNKANPQGHYNTTGEEIWADCDGDIDILVSGVGTGGTITGTGLFLKEKKPSIQVVAVEPEESPVLSGGNPGPHGLMGIGAGFVPEVLDTFAYDQVAQVNKAQAYEMARKLAQQEGILAGITSGAALYQGIAMAKEQAGKTIVVILPDTGERYLSTELFL
ncbi:MAG: cysteine synthase A [Eubacteriales bacterium]